MAFGKGFKFFQCSVFVFNFLLWLLSCSLLAVGGWLLTDDDAGRYVEKMTTTTTDDPSPYVITYSQVRETNMATTLAYLFLVFGAVLALVTVIGCCGAVRSHLCLLTTFIVLLSVLFLVLLGIGAWSYYRSNNVQAHTERLEQTVKRVFDEAADHYHTDPRSKEFLDTVQDKFKCCGAHNTTSGPYNDPRPPQCDMADDKACWPIYFDYVASHFEAFMRDRLTLIASLAIAFALCLGVHMLCVLLLRCAVLHRERSTRL